MFKREIKEEASNVYRFSEPAGNRLLNFYGIKEKKGWTLIDCGLPGSVELWVKEGVISGDINRLVITHGDADHLGSGAWLKESYPKLEVFCHPDDREHIENHSLMVKNRYDVARPSWGFGYPQKTLDILHGACGKDFMVDNTIREGDTFSISGDTWTVYHLPGHSPGHIGLLRDKDGIFIIGDAFLADGPPDSKGIASMPPTHEDISAYLQTIERVVGLGVELVLSGHWFPLKKDAFSELLNKSRQTVFRDIEIIVSFLREGEKSFEDILEELNKQVSTWGREENDHYLYAVNGYLKYLRANNKVYFTKNNKVKLV